MKATIAWSVTQAVEQRKKGKYLSARRQQYRDGF
jgi:hypothetical protein